MEQCGNNCEVAMEHLLAMADSPSRPERLAPAPAAPRTREVRFEMQAQRQSRTWSCKVCASVIYLLQCEGFGHCRIAHCLAEPEMLSTHPPCRQRSPCCFLGAEGRRAPRGRTMQQTA